MITGLDHVAVHCGDLDRSLRFYCDLLGLAVRHRGTLEGVDVATMLGRAAVSVRFADLELGQGRTLELIELQRTTSPRPSRPGATHLALGVDDAVAMHARLKGADVPVASDPVTLLDEGFWQGCIAFYASDPDGVTVELIQRRSTGPKTG